VQPPTAASTPNANMGQTNIGQVAKNDRTRVARQGYER
jgi:hypothetical protein